MHSISVECLPGDLVECIEVDVSDLEIGNVLHLSDLKLSAKLKLLSDPEAIMIAVSAPRAEEEEVEEVSEETEGAEPEIISEKKADEEAE